MKKAFTLIEVVIILFVMAMGVITALSLTLRSAYFQKNQVDLLTASFLAQEGVEILVNIRDTNAINNRDYNDWTGNGAAAAPYSSRYRLDIYHLIAEEVTHDDQTILKEDYMGFFFHDNYYSSSKFKRIVKIIDTVNDFSYAQVIVQWEQQGEVYEYILETILYDLSF